MAPVALAQEHGQPFTSWLNNHILANYTFPDHDTAIASILQQFIQGVCPITFCTCPDGTERRFCDGLQFKDDERRIRLEKRYGNGTRFTASGHTIARVILFNEIMREVYERDWHTDRFVEASLLPARLSGAEVTARVVTQRYYQTRRGDGAEQSGSALLTALPLEVRMQIYGYLIRGSQRFAQDDGVPATIVAHRSNTLHQAVEDAVPRATKQRRPPQTLTLVCKQVRVVVLSIFYSDNMFALPVSTYSEIRSNEQWLNTIGSRSISCLRNVVLEYEDGRLRRRISFGLNLRDLTAVMDVPYLEETQIWSSTPELQRWASLQKLQGTQYKVEALRRRLEELRSKDVGVVTAAEVMSLVEIVNPQQRLWRSFLRSHGVRQWCWPGPGEFSDTPS